MPEGHEEDEAVERRRRVGAREAEDVVEGDGRDAHGRGERQDVRGDEDERGHDRPQQEHQDDEDHGEDRRDDDLEVALAREPHVEVRGRASRRRARRCRPGRERRGASRWCPRPPTLSAAASSVACTMTWPSTTLGGWPGHETDLRAADPVRGVEHLRPPASALPSGAAIWTGEPDPAGKWRASTSCPVTESTFVRKRSDWAMPLALSVGQERRAGREQRASVTHPGAPRVARRPCRRRGPRCRGCRRRPRCGRGRPGGLPGQKMRRPMSSRTAGRKVSDATKAPAMPSAPTGSEALGAAELRQPQAEQPEDRRSRRSPRSARRRARQRGLHRRPRRLVVVQLLLEPRDEEQGVVGRGADDEDRQDALALAAEADRRRSWPAGRSTSAASGQAEHRRDEHREGQDRAAVDDEQDEEDDAEGDEEQDAVDAAEGDDEVGEEAAGPGDVDGQPGRDPTSTQRPRAGPARRHTDAVSPAMVSSALSARKATGTSTACLSWLGIASFGGDCRNSPTVRRGARRAPARGCRRRSAGRPARSAGGQPARSLDDDEVGQRLGVGRARARACSPTSTRPTGEGSSRCRWSAPRTAARRAGRRRPRWPARPAPRAGRPTAPPPASRPPLVMCPIMRCGWLTVPSGRSLGRMQVDLRLRWHSVPDYVDYHAAWDLQREVHADVVAGEEPDTVAAARAPGRLHRRQAHRAARAARSTARRSSTSTAAARSPGTGPASSSATRSCGCRDPVDVVAHVRRLEEALIRVCADFGVDDRPGRRGAAASGCCADPTAAPERKVGAIGIRVSRGVTMHGFALNCDADLAGTTASSRAGSPTPASPR